jgi:hypothetical protein
MTTMHLKLKTTAALPTVAARCLVRSPERTRNPGWRPRRRRQFGAEDALFALAFTVFVAAAWACFFWVWGP